MANSLAKKWLLHSMLIVLAFSDIAFQQQNLINQVYSTYDGANLPSNYSTYQSTPYTYQPQYPMYNFPYQYNNTYNQYYPENNPTPTPSNSNYYYNHSMLNNENYNYGSPASNESQISYVDYQNSGTGETNVGSAETTPNYNHPLYENDQSIEPLGLWRNSNPYFGIHQQPKTANIPIEESSNNSLPNKSIPMCEIIPQTYSEPNCNQTVKKYFFNKKTLECELFIHSSCDDGVNVFFSSYDHCASLCEVYYKENFITSLNIEPNIDQNNKEAVNRSEPSNTTTPVYPIPSTEDKKVSTVISFTVVQIWDAEFDSEQQFKLIKNIKNKIGEIYNQTNKYNATFLDITPKPDEIIPVNLTSARIIVEHYDDANPLIPLIEETHNHRMAPLVVLSESWKVGDNNQLMNSCNRMDIPMSINCKDSMYGCCYDEVMEAVGPNKQGCPEQNCPCKLFMVSFGVKFKPLNSSQNDTMIVNDINDLMEELNKTYEGQITDSLLDWRDCSSREKSENQTNVEITVVDMAILLKNKLADPFKPLFESFKMNKGFGNMSIVENSLIITHAYGVSSSDDKLKLHKPLLHLNFNKHQVQPNVTKRGHISSDYQYCGEAHDLSNTVSKQLPSISTIITDKQQQLSLAFWIHNNQKSSSETPDDPVNVLWAKNQLIDPSPIFYLKNNQMFANIFALNRTITCSDEMNKNSARNYWTHIVVTFDTTEGKIKLYQDGDIKKSCSSHQISNEKLVPIKEIIVGSYPNKNGYYQNGKNYLDELFIYSEILTHTSINELYQKCSDSVTSPPNNLTSKCNDDCPPPIHVPNTDSVNEKENSQNNTKIPLYPIRSCFEYRSRCSRHRTGIYEAITAVNSDGTTYITDNSTIFKSNIFCDMNTNGGGWELVLNSINGDGWSAAQILERNSDIPSLNSSFSAMGKFIEFTTDSSLTEKQYMIIVNKGEYVEGGIWNLTDNNNSSHSQILLEKKLGEWNNETNMNQRIPYILNDGVDLFITSSLDPKSEPFGTLASTSGLLEPYKAQSFDLVFGVSLWIRYKFKNYTRNIEVFDEMNQTEIEQYYLNVEIINPLNDDIIIYYDMGEEKKAFEVSAHNRSTLFNVIHSISMPLSVSFKAFAKSSLKQLYVNGRLSFESPISYLPNDFVIMIISQSGHGTEKPLVKNFDYDYILYNTLDYAVNVTVNFLETTPVKYLIPPRSYENWKTRFYATRKIDFVADASSSINHQNPLYIEGTSSYKLEPMISSSNDTNVLSITDEATIVSSKKDYHTCHSFLNIYNTLQYSVDIFWRDDSLMTTLKSNQSKLVQLHFNYASNISSIIRNISIYSCVHGKFYDSMCDIEVNGEKQAPFVCFESETPSVVDLVLTSKKSYSDFENDLKNIKYNIYAIGGESVCPPEIHGGYAHWNEWSECYIDRTTGGTNEGLKPHKIKSRSRSCDNPPPKNGGMACEEILIAANFETRVCVDDEPRVQNETKFLNNSNLQFNPINITLVNDVDSAVLVNWEIVLKSNQTWQRGNIVINHNSSRVISINNAEIVNSGVISLSAKNLNTGKLMLLRDSKHLNLQLDLIQNNLVINIGHAKANTLKRFYSQITVINQEEEAVYISFTKDGTLLSSLEEIPGNYTKKTFKYSFVSLNNRPSPIVVQAYSKNSAVYVNGLKEHVVKLCTSQFEYTILLISKNMSNFQIEHKRYVNFIVANMNPTENIQLKIEHSLLPQKTLILGPTKLVSFYRKLLLPNEYKFDPINLMLKVPNNNWEQFKTLPFLNNNTFIEYVPISNQMRYNNRSDHQIYNLNLKISNVGESVARVEWRAGLSEPLVTPGNEVRIFYHIKSPISLPVFPVRAYDAYYENDLFINGQNTSYIIASPEIASNYTNTLLISSTELPKQDNEEYVEPINAEIKIYNFLPTEKVTFFINWNHSYYESVNIESYSSLTYNYTKSYSNEIIVAEAVTSKDGVPVIINGTYRLGIRPLENNTKIVLHIGNKPKTHYFGIRLANIYKRPNINFHWTYKNENKNASFFNENQIDLAMKLSRMDTKPLTIWATNSNNNNQLWSINNKLERVVIPSATIKKSMSESLNDIKWVLLSVGSVIGNTNAENLENLTISYINYTAIVRVNTTQSNSTIFFFVKDHSDQFYEHFSIIQPLNNQPILLGCGSTCLNEKTLTILDKFGNLYLIDGKPNLKFNFTRNAVISIGQISAPKYKFDQVIIRNKLQEPLMVEWYAGLDKNITRGQVYIEPYSSLDIKQDINYVANQLVDDEIVYFKATTYDTQKRQLQLNGTISYPLSLNKNYSKNIYLLADSIDINVPDFISNHTNNETMLHKLYSLILDNTLDLTVKTTVNDKTYFIEPKGILEINQESSPKNQLLPIILSVQENSTQYPLLLNGTLGQVEFTLSKEKPATHIKITPPHLPSLPKSSYVFFGINNEGYIKDEPSIMVHGLLSDYKDKNNKSVGVMFTGNKSWAGIHLTGSNCVIEPTYCSKGFTIALRLLIGGSESTEAGAKYILDSGGHGGSSTGITLSAEGGKINFQVTTNSKTWLINAPYPVDRFFTVIASWQPESGLYLHIDGVLVSSEHNGEMLFSTQDLDINPNMLLGRNINGNTPSYSKFIMVYLTIFDKYFSQQEATMTYLQLSDPKRAKAQFNLLRLFNQLERSIKLEVSTNGNYPNKVLVPANTRGDILTLVDMNRTNDEIFKEKHVQIPKTIYVVISATDSELNTPLYINNQPSPIKLSLDNNEYKEYFNVILSAPTKVIDMQQFWRFSSLSVDGKKVEYSLPEIMVFGNVIENRANAIINQSLSLDGSSAYMKVEKFKELECLSQPLFCEKGFTLVITIRLNEIVNDDNNPHFIVDTGGHNGKGFSLFYLGGRLLAEVSQNKKVWKIETRLIIGEWIMVAVTWNPHNGGKLSMMINGNDLKQVDKSSDLQGSASYSNTTFIIGRPVVENSGTYGKFFIKKLALSEFVYDENDLMNYFLFYNNHNKNPSNTRYISVNFQNRAGQDILIKPDRGEHHSEGYLINAGLMLELRLEEKGVVTTYPIVFKAFGLTSDKEYLLNNDWSIVVNAEEDQTIVSNVIITTPLFCQKKEGLFPDPNDKSKFISCQEGIATRERCPTNSAWNDDLKSCSVTENKTVKIPGDLVQKNKTALQHPLVYFILKNSTPKNATIIQVYDTANSFNIGPFATVIWKPKSQLKYPTALVALEGDYNQKTLGERLLMNGQNVLMISSVPKPNETILIIHKNGSDWQEQKFILLHKLYGLHPNFEINSKRKIEVIMANLVDENVKIFDKSDVMIDFIVNSNEIVKIKIENTQPPKSIIFSASGSNQTFLINNRTSFDVSEELNNNNNTTNIGPSRVAKVAVIHKKDDSSWEEVYNNLVEIQNQVKKYNNSLILAVDNKTTPFFELNLRIKLMTPLDVILREITGTNFNVGMKSDVDKQNIATDLQLGLNVTSDHRLVFTASARDGETEKAILINGLAEWKLGEINNLTGTTLPVVIHELGQDWINHFNSLMGNFSSNISSSKSQIVPDILLWNYPQLYHLTVKFYNDLEGDIVIKSLDGILNITTVFPSRSTGTIDLYIPLSAVITFIAEDTDHNKLYLDNKPNISVSVASPIYHVVMVTRNQTANKETSIYPSSNIKNETMNKSSINIDSLKNENYANTKNFGETPATQRENSKPLLTSNTAVNDMGKLFS